MKPGQQAPRSYDFYRSIPKVDLHRHLEGALRLETLEELGLPGAGSLRELVQVGEQDVYGFENFLSKFQTLRQFYRSPEIIERLAYEAVVDAAADNVRYLELRFTPVALSRLKGFALGDVIDWVVAGTRAASQEHHVDVRLIASVNRHESVELAAQVMSLAAMRMEDGIVGLDLAGSEATHSALPFAGIFAEARQAGLHVTVHAGEWAGAGNVVEAIQILGAERIGHGVRVLEDPAAVAAARERQVAFEVCVTSNYQTGVVPAVHQHPLPDMIAQGLNVTLNTDDPSISAIRLSDEYRCACEDLGLSFDSLRACILAGANAAFLPESERYGLGKALEAELA